MPRAERIAVLLARGRPGFGGVARGGAARRAATRSSATSSVAEARERCGDGGFDVALLDLQLPDGSGLDVLREIAAEGCPSRRSC